MFKQGKGKMRLTIWLLTIAPLIALSIVMFTSVVVSAAAAPTIAIVGSADDVVNANFISDRSLYKDTAADELTLALQPTVTVTAQPTFTATVQPLVLPRLTPVVTTTVALSATPSSSVTVPSTSVMTTSTPATVTTEITTGVEAGTEPAVDEQVLDEEYAGPIEGTIIANRTDANVRFFVEGATYELAPLRSIGLTLPRVTAVLNLFNCDATLPETQEGCFWDPYLLDREGFYEVVSGAETGNTAGLTLQTAGTPPGNQVWLQNRTGKREQIFYAGDTYDLPPSTVREFTTESDAPAIFYLRSCVEAADRTVCEWSPKDADPGFYYALVEVTMAGAVPNSRVNTLELQPLFSNEGSVAPEAPPQVVCRLQVPVLNVRSGPGLQYQIISKVRSAEQEPATVVVVGRDEQGQWLAVDDQVVASGWVSGSSGFVSCDGDVTTLPVVEVTDGRLAPTPIPAQPSAPVENTTTGTDDDQSTSTEATLPNPAPTEAAPVEAPTAPAQTVLPGQALIVIHNGFDQQIRFTLDQRYRVDIGLSEYDLQPGESISLLVYPGMVTFSASTPWRGLSGNDDFVIEDQQTRDLWITFVPDPDGSGRWLLQF